MALRRAIEEILACGGNINQRLGELGITERAARRMLGRIIKDGEPQLALAASALLSCSRIVDDGEATSHVPGGAAAADAVASAASDASAEVIRHNVPGGAAAADAAVAADAVASTASAEVIRHNAPGSAAAADAGVAADAVASAASAEVIRQRVADQDNMPEGEVPDQEATRGRSGPKRPYEALLDSLNETISAQKETISAQKETIIAQNEAMHLQKCITRSEADVVNHHRWHSSRPFLGPVEMRQLTFAATSYSRHFKEWHFKELHDQFTVTTAELSTVATHLAEFTTANMLPSHVIGRVTGQEVGTYIAVTLNDLTLRVWEIKLNGGTVVTKHKIFVPPFISPYEAQTGHAEIFCDFIANCTGEFLQMCGTVAEEVVVGITIHLPFVSNSIDSAVVTRRFFYPKGGEGTDVVQLLQAAFTRHNLKAKVICFIKDMVGTLAARAYANPKTEMAINMDTCNAAFYAPMSKLTKQKGQPVESGEMIVNIEWGAFDNEQKILPLIHYDSKLDRESTNPGQHIFEKAVTGKHLGEIVRLVLVSLIDRGLIFEGQSLPGLNCPYSFSTILVSQIDLDCTDDLEYVRHILEDMGMQVITTLEDRKRVKEIVQLVITRAARLWAAVICGILRSHKRTERCQVILGQPCNLYMDEHIGNALGELMGEGAPTLAYTKSSDVGVGVGVVAAIV